MALAYTVRDRLLHRWAKTVETWLHKDVKIVCYLSAEFLLGPHLGNNLINLGIEDPVRQAVEAVGQNLDELLQQEEEPGLGNGGLGRLAACYMDSLATLQVPAIGFGIRYEHGIFHQEIRDGWQMEMTDNWLHLGNPWEIGRPEVHFEVKLGGHTVRERDADGRERLQVVRALLPEPEPAGEHGEPRERTGVVGIIVKKPREMPERRPVALFLVDGGLRQRHRRGAVAGDGFAMT